MQRVIGYIDGFNLYYGLKQRDWRQFYWIDPFALVASLLVPSQQLAEVKYFTARVRQPKGSPSISMLLGPIHKPKSY